MRRDALASLRIERGAMPAAKKSRRGWVWLILLLLISSGGFFGYRYVINADSMENRLSSAAWMPEMMQTRIDVRLVGVTVQKGRSADAVVVATGYIESRRQARIGARSPGRIDFISFEEGDRVSKGDLLAELDHKDLDASLAASAANVARSQAALAEQGILIQKALADKDRSEKLWESRSISEADLDVARFAYQSTIARKTFMQAELTLVEAQQRQAEQLLENMFIRCPFAGTVISKDAEAGESIMPGGLGGTSGRGSVATIADLDNLEIECDVQEDFIYRVSENQEADISVDAVPDKKYHGKVRRIIPLGDRARATIKVKVMISDADGFLFPEMSGTVFFLPKDKDAEVSDESRYFCPTTSVDRDAEGHAFVWIVDPESHAQKIEVRAGDDREGRIEITTGLTGRERIIVNPKELKVGTPVRIAE